MRRPSSDALSLTLPKTSRSKAKRRRIPRPPRRAILWLAISLFAGLAAVVDIITGEPVHAVLQASFSGIYWHLAMRTIQNSRYNPRGELLVILFLIVASISVSVSGIS